MINSSEREVLLLLSEGHTAKSVAAELNVSVNVVHERLREARRKTGASSSRELARQIAAQKNRAEDLVIPAVGLAPQSDANGPGEPRRDARSTKELWVMGMLALTMVTMMMLQSSALPPDAKTLASEASDTAELYRAARSPSSDAAHRLSAERKLDALYASRPGLHDVRSTCGGSICEISGVADAGSAPAVSSSLQDSRFESSVKSNGFVQRVGFAFGDGGSPGAAIRFVVYWSRG